MTDQGSYDSALQEIKAIFTFLTEDKPTPDDEIEAKDKLINLFSRLKKNSTYPEEINFIDRILQKLDEWDTLDLWFSETSLPDDIMNILNIPKSVETPKEEELAEVDNTPIAQTNGDSEIDLTDIFNKVSEQFKGEIENLKGTIDALKKELDKKDEPVKPPKRKREVHTITPNPKAKLAPPVIKIPVIKKLVKPPQTKLQSIPKIPTPPVIEPQETIKEHLTPIPTEPEEISLPVEDQELTPIPKKTSSIETVVIEESIKEDIPLKTEKRIITPIIPEKPKEASASESLESKPFLIEKPKISPVKIEEIESESIVSSGSDLFKVFSSVGNKSKEKPQEIIGFTEKPPKAEEKKKHDKKKKKDKDKDVQEPAVMPFINFNGSKTSVEPELESPNLENISEDKDTLYQELIALEGRRYSLERNFKDVEKNFNKGSISDADFKRQNNILKKQLNEITSRINNIRRIISSL